MQTSLSVLLLLQCCGLGLLLVASQPTPVPSGSTKWSAAIPGATASTFFGLPAFGPNNATFVCGNSTVYALQLSDGSVMWTFSADNACQYIAVSAEASAVIVATNTSIYSLSLYAGYMIWQFPFGNPSPAVPARPTIVGSYVFFTVENGRTSTPMQVLDLATGKKVFEDPSNIVAQTRLWYLSDLNALLYVQINLENPLATSQTLVLRSAAAPPFAYIWKRQAPPLDLAFGGGTVAFISNAILGMVVSTANGGNGIAAFNKSTGATLWEAYQWSNTNNFDFSSTTDPQSLNPVAFTLESFGDFTQSTLTGRDAVTGTKLWATNVTSGLPDLLPAGPNRVLACGTNNLVALDVQTGATVWTVPFPNPGQIIGNSVYSAADGQWLVVIGNGVKGVIDCYYA